jgi:hypothetical protein
MLLSGDFSTPDPENGIKPLDVRLSERHDFYRRRNITKAAATPGVIIGVGLTKS